MDNNLIWSFFKKQVIDPGNCTHCGACVGLNPNVLEFKDSSYGPIPFLKRKQLTKNENEALKIGWEICPGRGIPFPNLLSWIHSKIIKPSLIGPVKNIYTGHSNDDSIRKNGASGGVLSGIAIHLLESGEVQGAIVLKQGHRIPDKAEPIIATTREEILDAAQSIYSTTPILNILNKISAFKGKLLFIGLPEHIAVVRMLQYIKHPSVKNIKIIIGPFVGANMYPESVRAFLKMKNVSKNTKIRKLFWRFGDWPGKLRVELENNRIYETEKFYYNFLIPFYISKNSKLTPDFSNELTDISVGDAWSPKYESRKGGYSVIACRTKLGEKILNTMFLKNKIYLESESVVELIKMHSHMLDFKKIGTFLRIKIKKFLGSPVPQYDYFPINIFKKRFLFEIFSGLIFWIASRKLSRWILQKLSVEMMGKTFKYIRTRWKNLSRPNRNAGLTRVRFLLIKSKRWQQLTTLKIIIHGEK